MKLPTTQFLKVAATLALSVGVTIAMSRASNAVDYTWNVLGGGTQAWNSASNWNPSTGTPSTTSDTANLQAALASSLSLDLGAGVGASGTTTVAAIWFGGSSGAVTTDITGTSALVLNNAAANASVISGGVAGSINRVSAPLILGKSTDVSGSSTRDFTIAGNLGQVGGGQTFTNQMSTGQTLTIGSGTSSRIQLYDSLVPATGRNLIINNLSVANGTAQATAINALWDRGASNGTITIGNSQNPAMAYTMLVSQTSPANVQINRQRFVLAADNALGLGEVTANNSSTQNWGGTIQSTDDARILGNTSFRIANLISFTGSNSLTITGTFTMSNNRGFGNNIAAGKQLNLNGTVAVNNANSAAFTMIVEGSGKTVMNGRVINAITDTVSNSISKRGTGRLVLNNASNTLSGTWSSQGGLMVFGTAGSVGTAVIQTGSSGGVSYAPGTGDAGWAAFASKLTGSGTNFGYLALPAADSAANLNFSGTASGQLGNAPSLSVVGDGDMTYTGVVTPGSAGYNWGGLSGVLTLPANASTGANTVKYTNGGTVVVAGSQSYSGATTVQGVLMTTIQNGVASGTGALTTAATIAFPSTLVVDSLGNAGTASPLGSSSGAAANLVIDRATLKVTGGSPSSTDRLFTVGPNGATIENAGAGVITLGSGGGANVGPSGAATLTLTGTGDGILNSILADGAGALSLIKAGAGTWTLNGINTYSGTTLVSAGKLVVNGALGSGSLAISSGATLAGTGTVATLVFGAGSTLTFDPASTLTVTNTATFLSPSTFGVDDIVGLSSSTPDGTYTLVAGNVNTTGLANFGSSNAYDLGGGKSAWFQAGSLQLVVVPEPTTAVAALAGLGMAALLVRRRAT